MKILSKIFSILVLVIMLFVTACGGTGEETKCTHSWNDATCTEPQTCSNCGEIAGAAEGHDWRDSTCTEPQTCSNCGETVGTADGHNWRDSTCTEPQTCSSCGETTGRAKGHKWETATCIAAKKCYVCGKSEGTVGEHVDNGKGKCKYCYEDLLLLNMEKYFDAKLSIPTVGDKNFYCSVIYSNRTKYSIVHKSSFVTANGKMMYSDYSEGSRIGSSTSFTYFTEINENNRYKPSARTLYLDNNSLAYVILEVEGTTVWVKFGVDGVVAIGYSKYDIGVF